MRGWWLSCLTICSALAMSALADQPVSSMSPGDIAGAARALPGDGFLVSGQPNLEVLDALQKAGYTTVIDFRTDGEDRGIDEATEVEARGMSYVSLPIAGEAGISFENAQKLDALLADIGGPALLHCGTGNRAAALLALRARLNGATGEDALALGKSAGLTRMEPVVRKRLDEGPTVNR